MLLKWCTLNILVHILFDMTNRGKSEAEDQMPELFGCRCQDIVLTGLFRVNSSTLEEANYGNKTSPVVNTCPQVTHGNSSFCDAILQLLSSSNVSVSAFSPSKQSCISNDTQPTCHQGSLFRLSSDIEQCTWCNVSASTSTASNSITTVTSPTEKTTPATPTASVYAPRNSTTTVPVGKHSKSTSDDDTPVAVVVGVVISIVVVITAVVVGVVIWRHRLLAHTSPPADHTYVNAVNLGGSGIDLPNNTNPPLEYSSLEFGREASEINTYAPFQYSPSHHLSYTYDESTNYPQFSETIYANDISEITTPNESNGHFTPDSDDSRPNDSPDVYVEPSLLINDSGSSEYIGPSDHRGNEYVVADDDDECTGGLTYTNLNNGITESEYTNKVNSQLSQKDAIYSN